MPDRHGWIDIAERAPPDGKDVLVFCPAYRGRQMVAHHILRAGKSQWSVHGFWSDQIRWWKPLGKDPEEPGEVER